VNGNAVPEIASRNYLNWLKSSTVTPLNKHMKVTTKNMNEDLNKSIHRIAKASESRGAEIMQKAKAALAADPASSVNRRAREAKAHAASAPIIAAQIAETVRPGFRHLVTPVKK
jgi:hypothetical protein